MWGEIEHMWDEMEQLWVLWSRCEAAAAHW